MTKKILVLLSALLTCLHISAQGVVSGKVSDAASGMKMELVNIGILEKPQGTTTNADGRYRLRIALSDSITLRYSFTGYEPYQTRVKLVGDTVIDVSLKPLSKNLDAVEVSDEKTRHSTFTSIDVQKLDNTVGPTGGVESLLKTLPDVNSSNELSSQYSVRGGSFDENLVYINGVEVFRPMLIRNGQQEGMSIINSDLVDFILFSPGGFDATYGDKMSSVLDITYRPANDGFKAKVSGSLLGASASVQGSACERLYYAAGLRQHSNRYILSSLDTKGSYSTSYTDLQAWLSYAVNRKLDIGALAIASRNAYGLVPESATTAFGGFQQAMQLDVYFDGAEEDRFNTLLLATTADYRPSDEWRLRANLSFQHINENERYDIQSQYWLYAVGMGEQPGETERFDRGVGTFLEHARNRLATNIFTFDATAKRDVAMGNWQAGAKIQMEQVSDRLREWRWVDSAGYAMPTDLPVAGNPDNVPSSPILQLYANSNTSLNTLRASAYLQREVDYIMRHGSELIMTAGIRGSAYTTALANHGDALPSLSHTTLSPRLSVSLKPRWQRDMLFRLAAGIYNQAPFYREYRMPDGTLTDEVDPQTSYQVMGTADWNFHLWERPFKLTADIFYKYITDLVPYSIDNLRITYHPDQQAVAYATGLSLRINGDFVPGLESWASLSLLRTQEDIIGDTLGWLARPTDQRLSFKLFLQDYIPTMPWWSMSLSFIYASGTPISHPTGRRDVELRLPAYLRLDWGNTVHLAKFESIASSRMFRHIDDILVGIEVFNLFNFRNVMSYLWVSDYDNRAYRVPNYLTARQLNLKATILF